MSQNTLNNLLRGAALAAMLAGSSVAFAQTTYDASTGVTTDTSSSTGASTTDPGVPNTGAGGNAATNALVLLTTGLAAAGAGAYLLRQRFAI